LNNEASKALVTALLENVVIDAPDGPADSSASSTPKVKAKDGPATITSQESQEKAYDPSMLFLLELATSLAIRDEQSMKNFSAEVAGYCTEILRQRKHLHPILVERTLTYLMTLKKRGHETVCSLFAMLIEGCEHRNKSY
jgi:golgi-specific brefeldin A-resistance guanine nucleotide exchange factor 1